jgi:hypothetical protein
MQRHISLPTLVLATTLGTLAPALVTESAGAASTAPTTNPSDIDAAPEYERAAVTVDGEILFQVRGIPAYRPRNAPRPLVNASKRLSRIILWPPTL